MRFQAAFASGSSDRNTISAALIPVVISRCTIRVRCRRIGCLPFCVVLFSPSARPCRANDAKASQLLRYNVRIIPQTRLMRQRFRQNRIEQTHDTFRRSLMTCVHRPCIGGAALLYAKIMHLKHAAISNWVQSRNSGKSQTRDGNSAHRKSCSACCCSRTLLSRSSSFPHFQAAGRHTARVPIFAWDTQHTLQQRTPTLRRLFGKTDAADRIGRRHFALQTQICNRSGASIAWLIKTVTAAKP